MSSTGPVKRRSKKSSRPVLRRQVGDERLVGVQAQVPVQNQAQVGSVGDRSAKVAHLLHVPDPGPRPAGLPAPAAKRFCMPALWTGSIQDANSRLGVTTYTFFPS